MRQNIDEKWKEDPRKKQLAKRIGERAANGMRVEVNWLLLDHRGGPIPLSVFQFVDNWQDWVDCGLATVSGDEVLVTGADEYAEFFAKQRANGSKPKEAKRSQKKPKEAKPIQTKPTKPSFSSSISNSLEELNTLQPAVAVAEENPVTIYCDEYKARYGHHPVIGGKQAGILTRFAKNHPGRWQEIITGYLQMPDNWAVQRSHPVELLESKLNEIVRFKATGKVVTRKVAEHLEEAVDKAQGTLRKPRKSPDEIAREHEAMLAEAAGVKAIEGAS